MIVAGFLLFAIGAADLVRQFVPRRWGGYLAILVVLLILGGAADALAPMIVAPVLGALWLWSMPESRDARWSFWPAVALAFVCIVAVLWIGDRGTVGIVGEVWQLKTPFGAVSFDLAMLVLGVLVFLLESSNLVVRAALTGEHAWQPADAGIAAPPASDPPTMRGGFKGGRLIGPLERVIVFMLTLTAAYPVLAAMLAAKGIVRFPEISKDGESGGRAEYFLVGSLVSWVIGLGAAFLVWWCAHV
ncbi:hypothetical protein [Microbacterium sp.]|uniref:hypothetical protein n=1 Tax=Microbacterium sp. TaxID=51671 RepID=UPI002810D0E9|nr:hypothetical protein [Microbacterium sp.]